MPYLGAQDFVHSQLEKGVDIAYLTGRGKKHFSKVPSNL